MRKKNLVVIFLLSFIFVGLQAQKMATFSDLEKPTSLVLNDQYLYIVDNVVKVRVYDRSNFKFIKQFGDAGEGPKQFINRFVLITPLNEKLMINSLGKISYWTFTGEFISEKKGGGLTNFLFYPIKKKFVGMSQGAKDGVVLNSINLYDFDLKKEKELYSSAVTEKGGKLIIPRKNPTFQTMNDKIYVAAKPGFVLEILDVDGKVLKTIIKKDFKKKKFGDEDKKRFTKILVQQFRATEEVVKARVKFKNYYPAIVSSFVDKNFFYIITWETNILVDGEAKFYKYDLKGNFVEDFVAKFAMQENMQPYPLGMYDEKLYQLIENDDEDWELFVTPLKAK